MPLDLGTLGSRLDEARTVEAAGRVRAIVGLAIRAAVPGARLGELVEIVRRGLPPLPAEVVGFELDDVMLVPLGAAEGIGPDDPVHASGKTHEIVVGPALLGRVLDGLGQPIDGGPALVGERYAVMRDPPNPMTRARIERPMALGIRTLDGLLTTGEGQRVGLFAGSGVGKSTLLGQIARQAEADVFVVCLIGERGREVREFLEDSLGESGRARGVVVCATSDAPAMVRKKSAYVATAIAEHFRDQGKRVLFLLDSVTRFARAGREVGLSAGEPPARRGYPPSVFAELPRLLERSGNAERGSITAFYTVLVEGGDMEEPIADEVRGILDGHFILNRALGERNQWPAMDVLASLSRVMSHIVSPEHKKAAGKLRETLATYEKQRDLILLGAYQYGTDPRTDYAIDKYEAIIEYLKQDTHDSTPFDETVQRLVDLFADAT
jgi:type III secretion protein N (ATPase)